MFFHENIIDWHSRHPLTNSLCFAKMEKEEKDRFMKKLNSLLETVLLQNHRKSDEAAGRKKMYSEADLISLQDKKEDKGMLSLTFGEQVKIVLSRKNMTIKELAEEIENKTGKKMSRQNLTQRLGRDNFQEQDMRMIAEILGCPFQLNILSDEDRHGSVSEDIYASEIPDDKKDKRKKGKTIFLEPQTDLFQRMDELSPLERDITIGELVDIHEQLEQLEHEKDADHQGETGVLEYQVPDEEESESIKSEETAEEVRTEEVKEEEEEDTSAEMVSEEPEDAGEEEDVTEVTVQEEIQEEAAVEEQPEITSEESEAEEQKPEEQTEPEQTEEETKAEETPAEPEEEKAVVAEPEPAVIPESKPAKKRNPFTSVLKGYIRKASKAASREEATAETAEEKPAVDEPEKEAEIPEAAPEEETKEAETPETAADEGDGIDHIPLHRRGTQMMPNGIGEVNPYTGKEYETNSVRMHPNRIGYVQVYDRGEHQWADMTEWAFLGYQERKRALLGDKYEPPIYLD